MRAVCSRCQVGWVRKGPQISYPVLPSGPIAQLPSNDKFDMLPLFFLINHLPLLTYSFFNLFFFYILKVTHVHEKNSKQLRKM